MDSGLYTVEGSYFLLYVSIKGMICLECGHEVSGLFWRHDLSQRGKGMICPELGQHVSYFFRGCDLSQSGRA